MRKDLVKISLCVSVKIILLILISLVFFCSTYSANLLEDTTNLSPTLISDNTILYVGGQGEYNYTTIQDAINNSSGGYTIYVYNGTYHENIKINKTIILKGENPGATIIDAGGRGNALTLLTSNCSISGFTITNSGIEDDIYTNCGIYCSNVSSQIFQNHITHNKYGIVCLKGSSFVFNNNTYTHNHEGIYLENTSHTLIRNNTFLYNNQAISLLQSHDNTVIDCNISFNSIGIYFYSSIYNNIKRCTFLNNSQQGIYTHYSSHNTIQNNLLENSDVNLIYAPNHTLIQNNFFNGGLSFFGGGIANYAHLIDSSNTVNGKPIYYFFNKNNHLIDNMEIGQIILINCSNFTIKNLNISYTNQPLEIAFSHNLFLENLTLSFSNGGIRLYQSINNSITNSTIHNNSWSGIVLTYSSTNNRIFSNTISNLLDYGILASWMCKENSISQNTLSHNNNGIYLINCTDNNIYENNFFNNSLQASDDGTNYWSNESIGNYWSNFDTPTEGAWDNDSDGKIDMPYHIPNGDNHDQHPLTKPWKLKDHLPQITITKPSMYATIQDVISITGTAYDQDGPIQKVEISIDGTTWMTATGTNSWTYSWDTRTVDNADYILSARSYDGSHYSPIQAVTVTVQNTFTLYFNILPAQGGSVTLNTLDDSYPPGTLLTLTAIPANGYIFTAWTEDISDTNSTIQVIMNSDKSITAHFSKIDQDYTLNVTIIPLSTGTVTLNPQKGKYPQGAIVKATALPESGYIFTNWGGDSQSTSETIQIVMDDDKNIIAYFEAISSSNQLPIAYFTVSIDGHSVTFKDKSTDIDGTITSWTWEFGDDNTSQQQFPTHKYSHDGQYMVRLTVTDNFGGHNTYSAMLNVKQDKGGIPGFEGVIFMGAIILIYLIKRRLPT